MVGKTFPWGLVPLWRSVVAHLRPAYCICNLLQGPGGCLINGLCEVAAWDSRDRAQCRRNPPMPQPALHETPGSSEHGVPDQCQYAGSTSLSPFIPLSDILLYMENGQSWVH